MSLWLIAIILGLVEGITEFIPISSTGHLLLTEQFLRLDNVPLSETFFGTEIFNAVIQVGAMLAALPLFSDRLASLKQWRDPKVQAYFLKMFAAFCITVPGALIVKKLHMELPHDAKPIAWALLIGGIAFLVVEGYRAGHQGRSEVTWVIAIAIGLAQVLAVAFPGTSRSGATIIFALALGLARGPATEFSFLLGIPTLCAAGAKTTLDALQAHEVILWQPLIIATLVAAISSVFAVRWLLRYVQSHTFRGFGYYRIALGIVLLVLAFTHAAPHP